MDVEVDVIEQIERIVTITVDVPDGMDAEQMLQDYVSYHYNDLDWQESMNKVWLRIPKDEACH